jgi:hypothetical protein
VKGAGSRYSFDDETVFKVLKQSVSVVVLQTIFARTLISKEHNGFLLNSQSQKPSQRPMKPQPWNGQKILNPKSPHFSGTGAVTGAATGAATGEVPGEVAGAVTGRVTGPVTGAVTGVATGASPWSRPHETRVPLLE